MSRPTRSAAFDAACSRAAFSRRHSCQGPAKYVERPASSSRTAVVVASRNQRSCATRMTAASIDWSVSSSHSMLLTSRWFVGSSRRRRSGSPPRARASEARVKLAAGEGVQLAVEVLVREAEPAQGCVDALPPGVAAGVLEPGLSLGVPAERRRIVLSTGHRGFEPRELLLGRDQVSRAGERVLAQRQPALERRALVVQRDPRPLLEGELAAVQVCFSGQDPEQGRLPGPVRAGQGQPVAPLDLERDSVEQERPCDLLAEVGADDYRHGAKGRRRFRSAASARSSAA